MPYTQKTVAVIGTFGTFRIKLRELCGESTTRDRGIAEQQRGHHRVQCIKPVNLTTISMVGESRFWTYNMRQFFEQR
jgi:hypothetical protein